jgi:hypothetical protein
MTIRQAPRRRSFAVSLILVTFACGGTAWGDPGAGQLREQRQKEIAGKSEAERARLQRNFKAFRELPLAEQERLRRLDRELKEDAQAGGSLRLIMDEYYNWLATLTPGQQQDLRPTDDPEHPEKNDPARRVIRVGQFLKQQQDQADATGAARGARVPPRLSPKELDAVLGVVEEAMRAKHLLTPAEIQELEGKKELARHAAIWALAFRPRPGVQGAGPLPWMSKEVADAMIEAISNERLAQHIKSAQPMERSLRLVRVTFAGVKAEYDKLKPGKDELERFFVQLSFEQQDEIMRLPFDQQHQKLTQMYLARKSEEEPDRFPRQPLLPFWAGPRGAMMRAAAEQRSADGAGARKAGGGARKNAKERQKGQKTEQD